MFIQKADPNQAAVTFTCPVIDISETGISLDCAGVYANRQVVHGEIIFKSGRTAPINGVVLREEIGRTSLQLHCTLPPPLLMAEQRTLIEKQKAQGPRPAVNQRLLDSSRPSLPSHAPKGICRTNRR